MKKLSNKYIIIFSSLLCLIFLLFLLFLGRDNKAVTGRFTLVVDESTGDVNRFNKILLNMYDNNGSITTNYLINKEDDYLGFISKKLLTGDSADIYYTGFSSQVYNEIRKSENVSFFNNEFDELLPRAFITLTKDLDSFFYIPITWAPWGVYYNKTIFKELGLNIPKTIDDLNMLCDRLVEDKIIPFSMLQKIKWPLTAWFDYLNIRKNGANFHKQLLDGLIDFTDPRVFDIFNDIYIMINKKYFYENSHETNWLEMLELLEEKKSAMVLGGSFYYKNASNKLKEELGWFPFPLENINDEYDEVVTTSGYIVKENSDNKSVVIDYLNYSLSNSAQLTIMEDTPFYPVNETIIGKIESGYLISAYNNIKGARKLIPSFERNNNPDFHLPLKWSLNALFNVESREDITSILNKMEETRLSLSIKN